MKQASIVKTCQTELKYLKQNKDKAQEIRELLSTKEAPLASSKESVQRIESQIDPLENRMYDIDNSLRKVTMLDNDIKALDSRKKQMEDDNRELEEKMEQVFQGTDDQLQDMYQNHQKTVKEKERRLTECQRDLERAGRECQRMNRIKPDLLVEQGRLQLKADRHTQNIKKRDTQVKSLASFLELEGYDRTPLNERQLQSFHRQVKERLDQDTETLNQTMHDMLEKEAQNQQSIDILKKTKMEKEEQVRKIKSRHNEELVSLTGHFPSKKELEDWIYSKSKEINSTRDRLNKMNKELASGEQKKTHFTAEVKRKEEQLASYEERRFNV